MATTAAAIAEGLETARSLIQIVSRTFYQTRQSIVLDQLIRKEAMRDDQIAGLLGMTAKDITKILLVLVRDQIVAVHRRSELRVGAPKASMRTYYYLDYSHAIDVIKWRMYKIQNEIDKKLRNELQAQGYVCTRCKAAYKTEDVQHLVDLSLGCFICESPGCNTELVDNANVAEVQGSKDRMQRLIVQTKTIRELLKKMNDVLLPRFDVAKWLALNALPGVAVETISGANAPVKIEMTGDDDEALMKAQREADAEEKRAQNQLPTWIAQSTVSGEATAAHLDSLAKQPVTSSSFSLLSSSSAIDAVSNSNAAASTSKAAENELDSYYASLERAQSLANEAASIPPSPLFTPVGEGISTPKIETTSEDELDDVVVAAVAALTGAIKMGRGSPLPSSRSGSNSAKRSRDEEEPTMADEIAKKLKQDGDVDMKPMILDGAEDSEAEVLVEDEVEDEEDDFEEVDEEDPNPMISVEGKMIPYNQVKDDDDLSAAMTTDEYTAYWEVYQRLGG